MLTWYGLKWSPILVQSSRISPDWWICNPCLPGVSPVMLPIITVGPEGGKSWMNSISPVAPLSPILWRFAIACSPSRFWNLELWGLRTSAFSYIGDKYFIRTKIMEYSTLKWRQKLRKKILNYITYSFSVGLFIF